MSDGVCPKTNCPASILRSYQYKPFPIMATTAGRDLVWYYECSECRFLTSIESAIRSHLLPFFSESMMLENDHARLLQELSLQE